MNKGIFKRKIRQILTFSKEKNEFKFLIPCTPFNGELNAYKNFIACLYLKNLV